MQSFSPGDDPGGQIPWPSGPSRRISSGWGPPSPSSNGLWGHFCPSTQGLQEVASRIVVAWRGRPRPASGSAVLAFTTSDPPPHQVMVAGRPPAAARRLRPPGWDRGDESPPGGRCSSSLRTSSPSTSRGWPLLLPPGISPRRGPMPRGRRGLRSWRWRLGPDARPRLHNPHVPGRSVGIRTAREGG